MRVKKDLCDLRQNTTIDLLIACVTKAEKNNFDLIPKEKQMVNNCCNN